MNPSPAQRRDENELEGKLSALMAALQQNKDETGTDNWAGKPEQEPLPVSFKGGAKVIDLGTLDEGDDLAGLEIEKVSLAPAAKKSDSDSLDALMGEYVEQVRKGRKLQAAAEGEDQAPPTVADPATKPTGAAAKPSEYDDMSLTDLMSALDNFRDEDKQKPAE